MESQNRILTSFVVLRAPIQIRMASSTPLKVCFKHMIWLIWGLIGRTIYKPWVWSWLCIWSWLCSLTLWCGTCPLISLSNNGSLTPNLHKIFQESTEKEIWKLLVLFILPDGGNIISVRNTNLIIFYRINPDLQDTWRPKCVWV